MEPKIFISCGEQSGELYANKIIHHILSQNPNSKIQTTAHKIIKDSKGCQVVLDYSKISFMGLWAVLMHLRTIFAYLRTLKKKILQFNPDILILIDFPGMNLKLAKWGKQKKMKVVYIIPPKIWAWSEKRGKTLIASCDKIISILPFEKKYFLNKWNYKVEYYGNPLVEIIQEKIKKKVRFKFNTENIIAVLPGSREGEIKFILKPIIKIAKRFKDYKFIIAQGKNIDDKLFSIVKNKKRYSNVFIIKDATYDILRQSKMAIVKSGTATLETCIIGVPQIICYRGGWINYILVKLFVKLKLYSLPNLIANKKVIPELIQMNMRPSNISKYVKKYLSSNKEMQKIKRNYDRIIQAIFPYTQKSEPDKKSEIVLEKITSSIMALYNYQKE